MWAQAWQTAAAYMPLLSNVLERQGAKQQNAANAQMAREQMQFQERMSNTAYQRGAADIRAAGLNPALLYGHANASTPTGASAMMTNTAANTANSAAAAMQTYLNFRTAKAQLAQIEAQTLKTHTEARQLQLSGPLEISIREIEKMLRQQEHTRGGIYTTQYKDQIAAELERLRSQIRLLQTNAREGGARADLLELDKPRAENEARAERGLWRKYGQRNLSDAAQAARHTKEIAGTIVPAMGKFKKGGTTSYNNYSDYYDEYRRRAK